MTQRSLRSDPGRVLSSQMPVFQFVLQVQQAAFSQFSSPSAASGDKEFHYRNVDLQRDNPSANLNGMSE